MVIIKTLGANSALEGYGVIASIYENQTYCTVFSKTTVPQAEIFQRMFDTIISIKSSIKFFSEINNSVEDGARHRLERPCSQRGTIWQTSHRRLPSGELGIAGHCHRKVGRIEDTRGQG